MCNECIIIPVPENLLSSNFRVIKVINHYKINTLKFHCVTGPARTFYMKDGSPTQFFWYVLDKYVQNVSSQEEFEKSKEYRAWKLKAFR